MARPFLPLPRLSSPCLPYRLRYLHPNPLSLSFSLLPLQSVLSFLYVSRSLEQPLLACRFFSFPTPALWSFLTAGSRPRPLVLYRPGRLVSPYLPPHPSRVPAHPHKKPKSSVGAAGGFSLRFLLPSSHHSFFTSLLTFSVPRPLRLPRLPSFFHPRRFISCLSCEPCYTLVSFVPSPSPRLT